MGPIYKCTTKGNTTIIILSGEWLGQVVAAKEVYCEGDENQGEVLIIF